MLQAFYAKITDERHGGASKLKSDATYFTIADGMQSLSIFDFTLIFRFLSTLVIDAGPI